MARNKIKSATVKYGSATFEAYSAPSGKGETREALEVTAISDTVKQFIPGALKEIDEFTITLADQGSGMPTVDDEPKALEISVTLTDGTGSDTTATATFSKVIVTKVAPATVEGAGDRKAAVDVTFRPTGGATAA